jgi:DNA-binding NarL/FixJ family response regulator
MTIRVLLADEHNIVREGMRSLLEKDTEIEVVAMADNGRTAVRNPWPVISYIGIKTLL